MTTRILIASDTHLEMGARLPEELLRMAHMADHILHAGDLIRADVHTTLVALAPVTAVHGNVDDSEVRSVLPERTEVELAGVRIGMVHDAGPSGGRHDRLRAAFPECGVIVYGHSHQPEVARTQDGAVLIVNPGSPTQRRRAPWHSACWVEVVDGAVCAADLVRLP